MLRLRLAGFKAVAMAAVVCVECLSYCLVAHCNVSYRRLVARDWMNALFAVLSMSRKLALREMIRFSITRATISGPYCTLVVNLGPTMSTYLRT